MPSNRNPTPTATRCPRPLLLGRREASRHGAPVDDLPDLLQVVGAQVFVVEVVGVLPHVDRQQRQQAQLVGDQLLVARRDDGQLARRLVVRQPLRAERVRGGKGGGGGEGFRYKVKVGTRDTDSRCTPATLGTPMSKARRP